MNFRLAHLSDAHIGPVPRPNLAELLSKRATGYVNWLTKRAKQHDMEVLARLVADLGARQPHHVAMTGDIVNIGLDAELALAKRWLASLGAPHDVSFSPGNHDAYTPATMPRLREGFADWTRGDAGEAGYPYLRRRADVALIGLSSGVPTAPFIAGGRLGKAQLAALDALLAQSEREGLARVVFLHHPPHVGGAKTLRGLADAANFEAVIARRGAELVLHGHNHRRSVHRLPGPRGPVPVVGAASASARPGGHRPAASYNLFEIARRDDGFAVTGVSRGIDEGGTKIVDLGPIAL